MQFAPVCNLEMYKVLLKRDQLGTYHLLIATEIVRQLEAWSEFWSFPNIPEQLGKATFIILDNGLIETGSATDPQTLKEAADAVDANCIVLPDVYGDCNKTVKAVRSSLSEMKQTGYPLLGVVQASTWDEVDYIASFYVDMGVQYMSIPRIMVEKFGTRVSILHRLRHHNIPFHLLGFSENLWDDMVSANMPGVMGIDSAVPLWYRGMLPPTPPTNAGFGPRPKDFWTMDPHQVEYKNVERVREWLRGVPAVRMQGTQQELEETH